MCNRDPNEARKKLLGYIGESYFRECGGECGVAEDTVSEGSCLRMLKSLETSATELCRRPQRLCNQTGSTGCLQRNNPGIFI